MSDSGNGPTSAVEARIIERITELKGLKASLMDQAREYDKEISALNRVLNPIPEGSATKSKPGPKPKPEIARPTITNDEIAAAIPGAKPQ